MGNGTENGEWLQKWEKREVGGHGDYSSSQKEFCLNPWKRNIEVCF